MCAEDQPIGSPVVSARPAGVGPAGSRAGICACIRIEYRTAWPAELRGILLQAGDDPIDVGNLCAAKPENVGRAGHLLFHGSPVLLRKSRRLTDHAPRAGYRKTQENPVRSHIRSFPGIDAHVRSDKPVRSGFKMNEAGEGSRRTTKCEIRQKRDRLQGRKRLFPERQCYAATNIRKNTFGRRQRSGNPAATNARTIRSAAAI